MFFSIIRSLFNYKMLIYIKNKFYVSYDILSNIEIFLINEHTCEFNLLKK